MLNAMTWAFIVGASLCSIGSVFLSDAHRRLNHADAAELRRRRLLIAALRDDVRTRHRIPSHRRREGCMSSVGDRKPGAAVAVDAGAPARAEPGEGRLVPAPHALRRLPRARQDRPPF